MDWNFLKRFEDLKIPYGVWVGTDFKINWKWQFLEVENPIWCLGGNRLSNKLEVAVPGSRKNIVEKWSIPVPRP